MQIDIERKGDDMKRVIAACIDQVLEFDSEGSFKEYINDLESKKQWFRVLNSKVKDNGTVEVRIQKQYNRHTFM
jgi:hypothetical protein